MAAPSTLAIPGQQQLAAIAPAAGIAKVEPRLLSMLTHAKVPNDKIEILGNKDLGSMTVFGNIARGEKAEERFELFLKNVLNIDAVADPDHFGIAARITSVWQSARIEAVIKTTAEAERAHQQLPPQIATGELELAKQALENLQGFELPDHLCPSQPYFEKIIGYASGWFEAESLMMVTSKTQQKAHSMPPEWNFDSRTGTYKSSQKEFTIPMPQSPEDLRTRFEVMATWWVYVLFF